MWMRGSPAEDRGGISFVRAVAYCERCQVGEKFVGFFCCFSFAKQRLSINLFLLNYGDVFF